MWDRLSADRVDYFIANSINTQKRIKKYYRRESEVIYPPIDTKFFTPGQKKKDDGFYLVVSALEPYKNINLAIEAFKESNKPLVVVGSGSHKISISSCDSINYIGQVTDEDLRNYYRNCKALIFPTEEDFGMVPLEAQACGRPVIAYGKGGALESVVDGKTGIFFSEQTPESLIGAVNKFEEMKFDPKVIRENAERFSQKVFEDKFSKFVSAKYKEYTSK
jgi:glycosyltransferase involved in cell wall biosynthesis